MFKIGLLFLFLLCNTPFIAQIPDAVKKEIDTRVSTKKYPSIAIGIFKDGKSDFYISGVKNSEKEEKATVETLYEIGSITKTFTSLLLAKIATEGTLNIEDPIAKYLPNSLKLADTSGKQITFTHLATHTSGLYRLPHKGFTPSNMKDPYQDYTRNDLFTYLTNYERQPVGEKHAYSNLAVGLLGETLSVIKNKPYKRLIQDELLEPLQLTKTYFEVPDSNQINFAIGYTQGKPTPPWGFQSMAGAGALRSTITDLIAYGKSYLENNPLSEAQNLVTKIYFENGKGLTMGLGWFKKNGVLWHNGGTYGFRSYVAINPSQKIVVAVLTNTGDEDPADLAQYILSPEMYPLFGTETTKKISGQELQKYVGTYYNEQYNAIFLMTASEGKLNAKLNKQQKFPTEFIGNHTFEVKKVKARLQFKEENDTIEALTLFQNGFQIEYVKQK